MGLSNCLVLSAVSFPSLPPRGRGTTKWWKELYGTNDQGEENNYISGNSEIISSKNVSSRGLPHPLRGSSLPEGAKNTTTPKAPNPPTNPNLNISPNFNIPSVKKSSHSAFCANSFLYHAIVSSIERVTSQSIRAVSSRRHAAKVLTICSPMRATSSPADPAM